MAKRASVPPRLLECTSLKPKNSQGNTCARAKETEGQIARMPTHDLRRQDFRKPNKQSNHAHPLPLLHAPVDKVLTSRKRRRKEGKERAPGRDGGQRGLRCKGY